MEWIAWTIAITGRVIAEVGGGGGGSDPSFVIDLMDMQWWQAILAVVAALGLSPAPWVLGLAAGKIQFTSTAEAIYEKRIAELGEYHAKVLEGEQKRYTDLQATAAKSENAALKNEQAVAIERQRADTATEALAESTDVVRMAMHIVQELRQAAQEVTPSGE
ncbi:membrane protein [Microbacterium phage Fregley]|nr:membrane protein [Microbacterium phage Fregley]